MLAWYMLWPCVFLSVCLSVYIYLSVCLSLSVCQFITSHSSIKMAKYSMMRICEQCHTIAEGL